jgi:hypothetical protein
MAKIKHISGIEFDEEKLNRINNAFTEVYAACLSEQKSSRTLGPKIPGKKIRKEMNLRWPWWKRLFMSPKKKKLEKAKITCDLINQKKNCDDLKNELIM